MYIVTIIYKVNIILIELNKYLENYDEENIFNDFRF